MVIAIDAGHYLGTPGRRCLKEYDPRETKEWELNSRVAEKIEAILSGYDCDVIRCDDPTGQEDIALSRRCSKANDAGAAFFVSIHHNAGINGGSGGGIVSYSCPGSTKGAEWRDALYAALIAKTGLKGNRSNPCPTASYQVLRQTNAPAVLVELGFMDSPADIPIILTDDYAELCAEAIAETIVGRLGIKNLAADPEPELISEEDWIPGPFLESNVLTVPDERYHDIDQIPDWGRDTIAKIMRLNYLRGGDGGDLNLSEDMLRILVILDRAGSFKE